MKDGGELVALLRQIAAIDFRTDAIPAHLLDTVGEAADALSQANARADAAEAGRDEADRWIHEATKTITGLTAGGSEYFGRRVRDVYRADLPFCAQRIREKIDHASEWTKQAVRDPKAAEARCAVLARELAEAREECAKIADEEWSSAMTKADSAWETGEPRLAGYDKYIAIANAAARIASAIRARSSLKEASDASKEPT